MRFGVPGRGRVFVQLRTQHLIDFQNSGTRVRPYMASMSTSNELVQT